MYVSFALFADAANISREGKLNILGVFDAIQVGALPAIHPRASLVVRLKGGAEDAGTHSLILRWLNPHGDELWNSAGQLEVGAPPPGSGEMDFPLIASLDLPADLAGGYTLQIVIDGEAVTNVPLLVQGQVRVQGGAMSGQGLVS